MDKKKSAPPPRNNGSVIKALAIMDVLKRNFFHGFSPGELSKATGYCASDITRYTQTLEAAGWVERITETGRLRPSARFAQYALEIMRAMDAAKEQMEQLNHRLHRN